MHLTIRAVFLVCVVSLLSGCLAAKHSPLAAPVLDTSAKSNLSDSNKGTVYIIRPDVYRGRAAYFALAVDDKVIGWTSVGTYYRLDLSPGTYRFATFGTMNLKHNDAISTEYKDVTVVGGKQQYLLHTIRLLDPSFVDIDETRGRTELNKCRLARFDARNLPLSNFKAIFDKSDSASQQLQQTEVGARAASSINFSDVLEGLAAVLLIGLVVAGAAYGHAPTVNPPPQLTAPMAIYSAADLNYKTSRGASYQANGGNAVVGSNGEQWRITGRTVSSSNGASYRLSESGNMVYGDRGQTYTISSSGRQITGSDGSACRVSLSGRMINCE